MDEFDALPKFDSSKFQPPAWASSSQFQWKRNSTSCKSTSNDAEAGDTTKDEVHVKQDSDSESTDQEDSLAGDEEVWEDASEILSGLDPAAAVFSTEELSDLLKRASECKAQGNQYFTAKPPDYQQAIDAYKKALGFLPDIPDKDAAQMPENSEPASGIQEVTEEEAELIAQAERDAKEPLDPEVALRTQVEGDIRECTKACWGNLAACHNATKEYKAAVEAGTKALAIDPHYTKALQRRALANDILSTWTSLTSAEEDYKLLISLLPTSSPHVAAARKALSKLPERIRVQQEKEKDEMLGKLKELGNGLLGAFGLNTDMFKFDQQEGGGYNMRFES